MQSTSSNYAFSEPMSDDLHDYDVISAGHFSPGSSIADLSQLPAVHELVPSQAAKDAYETVNFGAEQIQEYVSKAVNGSAPVKSPFVMDKAVRVYVDGLYDVFHVGDALQLRQAKLSFPSVYLMVGAFSDADCKQHNVQFVVSHTERCELLRHCRWVDEVIYDAPFVVDEKFLAKYRIDYVAIEEGSSIDPSVDKARLAGYDLVKAAGKAIPTRRTKGVARQRLIQRLSSSPEPSTNDEVWKAGVAA